MTGACAKYRMSYSPDVSSPGEYELRRSLQSLISCPTASRSSKRTNYRVPSRRSVGFAFSRHAVVQGVSRHRLRGWGRGGGGRSTSVRRKRNHSNVKTRTYLLHWSVTTSAPNHDQRRTQGEWDLRLNEKFVQTCFRMFVSNFFCCNNRLFHIGIYSELSRRKHQIVS